MALEGLTRFMQRSAGDAEPITESVQGAQQMVYIPA